MDPKQKNLTALTVTLKTVDAEGMEGLPENFLMTMHEALRDLSETQKESMMTEVFQALAQEEADERINALKERFKDLTPSNTPIDATEVQELLENYSVDMIEKLRGGQPFQEKLANIACFFDRLSENEEAILVVTIADFILQYNKIDLNNEFESRLSSLRDAANATAFTPKKAKLAKETETAAAPETPNKDEKGKEKASPSLTPLADSKKQKENHYPLTPPASPAATPTQPKRPTREEILRAARAAGF